MKSKVVRMMAAVLVMAGIVGQAEEPKGWKFETTPYAWLAGVEGDATINGHKVDFDKSFSDLVDYVDVAASMLGVIQYDRYVFWGQADYFQMSTDALDVEDQPQGGSLDTKMLLGEMAFGYQVDGWMEGQTFDLLVGVRGLQIKNELDLVNGESASRENNLVDPMFVMRPSIPVFPSKITGLRFNPTLAIGGGGDSDLVYELQPQFQYQISDHVAARLGYRTVGYKFKGDKNENNELNIALTGAIAGVSVMF